MRKQTRVKPKKNRECAALESIPSTLLRAHSYTALWAVLCVLRRLLQRAVGYFVSDNKVQAPC